MRLGVNPSKSTRRGWQVSGVVAAGVAGFVAGRRGQLVQGLLRAGGVNGVFKLALRLQPQLKAAYGTLQTVDKISSAVGTGAALLSYNGAAGRTTVKERRLLLFEGTRQVDVWGSRLTGLLNRSDQLSRNVISSRGVMFRVGSTMWHSGTSVVQTSAGARILTHLRSLNLLGRHYYFDRPLAASNAAGIAAGQLDPATVPGFKGQVSGAESLVPAWAALKHARWRRNTSVTSRTDCRAGKTGGAVVTGQADAGKHDHGAGTAQRTGEKKERHAIITQAVAHRSEYGRKLLYKLRPWLQQQRLSMGWDRWFGLLR